MIKSARFPDRPEVSGNCRFIHLETGSREFMASLYLTVFSLLFFSHPAPLAT